MGTGIPNDNSTTFFYNNIDYSSTPYKTAKLSPQMDFTGTSFISKWCKENNILRIRILQLEDNTFDLLNIILDAAVEQGKFSVAWDLSKMQTLTTYQCFCIVNPCMRIKEQICLSVIRSSVITSQKYSKIINKLLTWVPPTTPTYVGTNSAQAKQFVGL